MTNENYWDYEKAGKQFEALVEASVVAPQFITKDGKPVLVMISVEKYQELTQKSQVHEKSFKEVLLSAPRFGFTIKRSKDTGRSVDF